MIDTFNIRDWPDKPRRAFMLTLPISLPLWLAAVLSVGAGFSIIAAVLIAYKVARMFWDGYE